ncbi:MAG: hypothetical protein U0411_13190 [Thermodesulfovibrionales bacterium]
MRKAFWGGLVFLAGLLLITVPVPAQSPGSETEVPPIAQPPVREGALALQLAGVLQPGASEDETEAESALGSLGIAPRNGWIADYPVTPDIIGEVRTAVMNAADSGRIAMSREEALDAFQQVIAGLNLPLRPYAGETYEGVPPAEERYPTPPIINNYYYSEGPPIVTYYTPPPPYYSLYAWVPYPFWCYNYWFPGFFILHDFHRVVIVKRRAGIVTNHFNDFRAHRVFRIDPVDRFKNRTFGGIGVHDPRSVLSTGIPRSGRTIFNRRNGLTTPGGEGGRPPSGGRVSVLPPRRGAVYRLPARGGSVRTQGEGSRPPPRKPSPPLAPKPSEPSRRRKSSVPL